MAEAYLDIRVKQGESLSVVTTWTDTTGTAVNLTGYTAVMKVRATPSTSSPAVLSLTSSSGIALGGAAGTVTITRSAAQTALLTAGNYYYDLLLTNPGGTVTDFLEGQFVVPFAFSQ